MSTLVILESPNKVKKVAAILGSGYVVKASFGHVTDMPLKEFGIDPATMEEKYVVSPPRPGAFVTAQKIIDGLKAEVAKADQVFLATDPDREGEAIAWHLKRELKLADSKCFRIEFNAITKEKITEAIAKRRKINESWVDAQRSRRVIDRILGYGISPLLSREVSGAKSAGRVQSAALHILATREREINTFVPKDRFSISGTFSQNGAGAFEAKLLATPAAMAFATTVQDDGNAVDENGEALVQEGGFILSEKPLDALEAALKAIPVWEVKSVRTKQVNQNAQAPFNTSALQQIGSKLCKWSGEKTMKLAQLLFENAHITYHRTDSVRVEASDAAAAAALIEQKYGQKYLPSRPNIYKDKDGVQGGHPAITPTHLEVEQITLSSEDHEQKFGNDCRRLYRMIRYQFIKSQMAAGINAIKVVVIGEQGGDSYKFQEQVSQVEFDGWRIVDKAPDAEALRSDKDSDITVSEGVINCQKVEQDKSQTRAKPRFREHTLVAQLEKFGIGRPSSWASVAKTLADRTYITIKNQELTTTPLGLRADDWLSAKAALYVSTAYTAGVEASLDEVEHGKVQRVPFLRQFMQEFTSYFGEISFSGGGGGPVSEKQQAVLESLRTRGVDVPEIKTIGEAKEYLDKIFAEMKPSEKQVSFAQSLAKQTGLTLTDAILASGQQTKAFIDKAMKAPKINNELPDDRPPSPKQLEWANKIAAEKGVTLPPGVLTSMKQCGEFLDQHFGTKKKK